MHNTKCAVLTNPLKSTSVVVGSSLVVDDMAGSGIGVVDSNKINKGSVLIGVVIVVSADAVVVGDFSVVVSFAMNNCSISSEAKVNKSWDFGISSVVDENLYLLGRNFKGRGVYFGLWLYFGFAVVLLTSLISADSNDSSAFTSSFTSFCNFGFNLATLLSRSVEFLNLAKYF